MPEASGSGDAYVAARQRMVAEQLEARGIRDPRVTEAFARVPRHRFVDAADAYRSYGDHPIGIGRDQTISQPYIVALMTEALAVGPGDRVLEVGTGSGYQAAILAELGCQVFTIERHRALSDRAREVLRDLGYDQVQFHHGDGSLGWPAEAPYDGILVTAAAPSAPPALFSQLAMGASAVIPVGDTETQALTLYTRRPGGVESRKLCDCVFVPLLGAAGWDPGS